MTEQSKPLGGAQSVATADDLRAVYEDFQASSPDAKWMSPTAAMIRAILSRYDVVAKGAAQPPAAPVETDQIDGDALLTRSSAETSEHLAEATRGVAAGLGLNWGDNWDAKTRQEVIGHLLKVAKVLDRQLATSGEPQTVLTWAPNAKPNENCHYDHTTAETPFGSYRIEWKSWKDYPGYGIEFNGQFLTEESRLEDAKDTALADFNKRLTACLALSRPKGK